MVAAWEQNATDNTLKIEATWKGSPHLLPAIPVGAHSIVVFDADRKSNGPDGVAAFRALCLEHGIDLSGAFVVDTPSGGQHFYWRTDAPYSNSPGSLPDGIDVRGIGGYVIGPGATLPDGRSYRITAGTWDTIPPLPASLAGLLREKQPTASAELARGSTGLTVTWRERAFAEAALADEVAKLAVMGEGSGRNAATNQAAHSLSTMEEWIDLNIVRSELFQANVVNGYVAKDGAEAIRRTIDSGIEAGRLKPRQSLSDSVPPIDMSAMIANGIAAYRRKHSEPTPAASRKRTVTVLQGSQIQAQPIEWLWDGYLPSGKLTLLAGAGGTGKSTIAFNLAATITNAGIWPDGSRCNVAGNVLIWSSEDDPADTIKPRLMAVGANDSRYGVISGTIDNEGLRCPFDAAQDMDELRVEVSRIGGISLLIVDPIITAVTGDMHKANDVRRSLQSIVDFAAEMRCAVLGITHFAKGTAGKNSAERVIGSQAFAALARMVLVAAKEEDSDRRVFTRAKSNNSIDTGGFSYSIEALTLQRGIIATRVVWGEPLEGSSRSILSEIEGDSPEDGGSKLAQAKAFLVEMLKNGFVSSRELFEHGRETHGITPDTMRRAGKALSIVPRKLAMSGGWVWELPPLQTSGRA
jgi:hypothetical protein